MRVSQQHAGYEPRLLAGSHSHDKQGADKGGFVREGKGKTHKVNVVEEVRDIINFYIREIAKTNPDDYNETDGSNKVDENDMQINEEDDV
nr:hypothetical protein [Tanacetum cinerariifolium]